MLLALLKKVLAVNFLKSVLTQLALAEAAQPKKICVWGVRR
jgi:hypothetical protein